MGRGSSKAGNSADVTKMNYREFPDVATDPWDYDGDGKAQVEFFKNNSNQDEVVKSMDREERSATIDWAQGWFMHGQQYEGWDKMNNDDKGMTQHLDDVCDRSIIKSGFVTRRLAGPSFLKGLGVGRGSSGDKIEQALMKNKDGLLKSKAHMSSGVASEGLGIGKTKFITYNLHVPPSKGAGMWIGDRRINDWGPTQREFLVNRDTVWKIGGYSRNGDYFSIDLYYVGREKHDYGTSGRV